MITYKVKRWDISVHPPNSLEPGHVCQVILGINATDSESGLSAYMDEAIRVHPCMSQESFAENSEQWIENYIGSNGWYLALQTKIAKQMVSPVSAPSGSPRPDFEKMTIGDGWSEFSDSVVPKKKEEEEDKPAEEAKEDAKEEDAPPAEEAKPAAKKKAAPKE